jgi:REP element-mobilizing transposase RayT
MRYLPVRRHVPHWEYAGGTVCITWHLHREQSPLTEEERGQTFEVIRRGDGVAGDLLAAVVMDDHVHAVVALGPDWTCQRVAQTWKSVSSHGMTKAGGRQAPVWQREYFDRWIADAGRVDRCIEYVLANPRRRWPGTENYTWLIERRRVR